METEFLILSKGISRDEEREFAKALQFMGYESAVLFLSQYNNDSSLDIPQVSIKYGELLDKNNNRRKTKTILCILDCEGLKEDEIIKIIKKERIDIITNITPSTETKKIMQYPHSAFSEAFFQNLVNHSIMIGFSQRILTETNNLVFNKFMARLAFKNKVPIIFSSFASNPDKIRSYDDFRGLAEALGLKSDYFAKSTNWKNEVVIKEFSHSFSVRTERKL